MHLIKKIKSYFLKYEFSSWKDFQWDNYEISFREINDDVLLEIGIFLKKNLNESAQLSNKRHRLKEESALECSTLDELLPLLQEIIASDFSETYRESLQYNWEFKYFVSEHANCKNTICISNGLRSTAKMGNCIYPLASIRKHQGNYYCWNHLV
ncbi:MAG: hypothetical protein EOO51_09490 [Flavobacterium sp.]|nr:MAG: hypothetical protein EOO51_09490 [Flavobacterium sp.]